VMGDLDVTHDSTFGRPARRHSLGRDIMIALALKLAALAILYLTFFSPSHRLDVTPERIAAALFGDAGSQDWH